MSRHVGGYRAGRRGRQEQRHGHEADVFHVPRRAWCVRAAVRDRWCAFSGFGAHTSRWRDGGNQARHWHGTIPVGGSALLTQRVESVCLYSVCLCDAMHAMHAMRLALSLCSQRRWDGCVVGRLVFVHFVCRFGAPCGSTAQRTSTRACGSA